MSSPNFLSGTMVPYTDPDVSVMKPNVDESSPANEEAARFSSGEACDIFATDG